MPFDASLDKEIAKEEKEYESTKIAVAIMSYNEGQQKVQISRQNRNDNGWMFSKLGRLTAQEAKDVYEMLGKIVAKLE